MKKLTRYGFFLIVVLLVGLTIFAITSQVVYATESEQSSSDAGKQAAIEAADRAIHWIPNRFRFLVPSIVEKINEARWLADIAMNVYGATSADFADYNKLIEAEWQVKRINAIQAARDAIDLIPPRMQITKEHAPLIEEARRLVNIAIEQYGATEFDICWRYFELKEAEKRLPEKVVPEPKPEPEPLPVTGAMATTIISGLLLSGAGLLILGKRKNRY